MNKPTRRCLFLAAAWGVTPASAAVPVDLLLPAEPVAQPGNVQVGSFNTFVYGDSGDLVFSASSFVPGGSALDRIFRLRAGQTQLEVIGFSQTSVDGESTFISFFDGMTDGGVAYTYDGRVLATGPDLTPPFTAVLGPNSPIIGLDPSAQNFSINAPAYADRAPGLVIAAQAASFSPFRQYVVRSFNGVNEIVLERDATYQLDDGPFTTDRGVGPYIGITSDGLVIANIAREAPDGGGVFGVETKLVGVDAQNNVSEIADLFGPVAGAVPDATMSFIDDFTFRVSDRPSLLFTGGIAGTGIDFTNSEVIFYSEEGQPLRVIAQVGEPLPGDDEPITDFSFDRPNLSQASGTLQFNVGLPGNADSLFQPRDAIVWGDPDDLRMFKGYEPVPGTSKIPATVSAGQEIQMSPDGLVAFVVEAFDDPINQTGRANLLYATNAAGVLQLLVQTGTRAPEFDRDGLFAYWQSVGFNGFASNRYFNSCGELIVDGEIRLFNADGDFFGDRVRGLFRFRLFHPDFDCNGLLDLTDLVSFATFFTSSDPRADTDGNGLFDLADVVNFVTAFNGL